MAIFDNDGTALCEAGKMYDSDGTADFQIGKAYDNDGTVDSLIYTAEYVFFPNANTSNINNWDYTGSFGVTENGITCYFSSAGSGGNINKYPVDFSKYKKLYITIASVNGDGNNNFNIRWRRTSNNAIATAIEVDELAASE